MKKKQLRRNERNRVKALLSAALLIPGLYIGSVSAQTAPSSPEVRIGYMEYRDAQKSDDRMRVHTPHAWFRLPGFGKSEVEGSLTFDSMSGASPYFLSTLSGASGMGVDDQRKAGDLKYTHYLDSFSVGLGGAISTENDYLSKTISGESRIWSDDKNTTFTIAGSLTGDDISSRIDARVDEDRRTGSVLVGITQVIDDKSLVQSNVSFSSGDGYYSDPYKPLDNRPRSREEWAWLTQYRRFLSDYDAALHLDYRLFADSWDVMAHNVSVAWYQNIGESWVIRPSIRYYTQSEASFFDSEVPPVDREKRFSADQRLSDFGSVTAGIKLEYAMAKDLSVSVSADVMHQRSGLAAFGHEATDIKPFNAAFGIVQLIKRFP